MVTRAGFTIVEVVVAFVLFAVALLGLAAVSAVAAGTMTRALTSERTAHRAAALLDSLSFDPAAASGSAARAGIELDWTVDASTIEVRARAPQDSAPLVLRGRRIPFLPAREL